MLFLTLLLLGEMPLCDWYTAEIYMLLLTVLLMVDMMLFSMLVGGDDVVGSVAGDEGYVVDGVSAEVADVVVNWAAA